MTGQPRLTSGVALNGAVRPVRPAPALLALLCGFTVPLKVARLDIGGLSVYATFIVAAIVAVRYWRPVVELAIDWFRVPIFVLAGFALAGVARGVGPVQPVITIAKLSVALVVAAVFGVLLIRSSRWVYRGLFGGLAVTVVYMAYQMVSSTFFGFGLPFTTNARLQIGRGLSQRYGLRRVTGFTEEPSFVATMLVGLTLLLVAYAIREGRPKMLAGSVLLGGLGLAMSTSNNFLGTTIIVASFWPLIRRRRIVLLMSVYYFAALLVTPFVLMRGLTYFARFSAYDIFLKSGPLDQTIGRGVGSYPEFFESNPVRFQNVDIDSLASLWGGLLFEGGVVLVALAIWWIARIMRDAGWREALALIATLLMLSNFNSPWWPIVSLAVAQCLVYRRKEFSWTTNSILPVT